MKNILIFIVSIVFMSANTCILKSQEIVLFDSSTPLGGVKSQDQGRFERLDSTLLVSVEGNGLYPGIVIENKWDLSGYNQLVIELENLESRGSLPVTVRLENPDADVNKNKGAFIDRVRIPARTTQTVVVKLPPALPYPDVYEQFTGMRSTPYYSLPGTVANIDLAKVTTLSLYINTPSMDWKWSVKRVVAKAGATAKLSAWMKLPKDKFFPFIDVYGQFKHKDWPGKVHSDNDLKKNLEQELADIASNPGPVEWNQYGGWKNGPKMKATGYFRVEKLNDKWWMVDPEGCLYWSHGVVRVTPSCAITPLDNRKEYFENLPAGNTAFAEFYTTRDELLYPYYTARNIKETYDFSAANIKRKYGKDWREQYAEIAHKRLKSWGLNTIANSSDKGICLQDKTPYADRFELKSPDIEGSNNRWWKFKDPFHPEFRSNFRKQLLDRKRELDDPWCLGFFVDNEIKWGEETSLAEWTLQSPAHQPAKIEMIDRLKKKYVDIKQLNTAWGADYAGWDALLQSTEKPPKGSKEDCIEFTKVITEAYFKNIREEFKKVAPNKLYMGCRFADSNRSALYIGAKYCDVISFNIYKHTLKDFKLPKGVDLPVMIGEFHFGALDRGMFHPGLVKTKNQAERALAYAAYVESALNHPNIIGTHWHQFSDQATTGRFDGENFQVGFTDVCDTPYPETIGKIREVGYKMYNTRYGQ